MWWKRLHPEENARKHASISATAGAFKHRARETNVLEDCVSTACGYQLEDSTS